MKFKEIKPGMVIHCPKEEDARALLEHLKELGYSWLIKGDLASINYWTRYGESTVYYLNDKKHVTFSSIIKAIEIEHKTITEFSDLIEPDSDIVTEMKWEFGPEKGYFEGKPVSDSPMTAKEIICWLKDNKYTGGCTDVFGSSSVEYILSSWSADTIVEAITAYEAAKKAPKPVEVEWVDVLRIYRGLLDDDGELLTTFVNYPPEPDTEKWAEEIMKEYGKRCVRPVYGVIERRCGVKKDEP